MTTDQVTLTGIVATTPRRITTSDGLDIASFRLASTQRRYDQTMRQWVDAETNWYTVTAFRQLAINIYTSINKGDRVIVTGALRIRDWDNAGKTGTTIEVDADAIGHDLSWGSSNWSRTTSTAPAAEMPEQDTETTSPATEPAQA
jgi:single-strand DNA-binding protein